MRCKECLNIVKHPTKKTKMLQICGKCRDLKTGIKYSTMSHFAIQYTVKSCLETNLETGCTREAFASFPQVSEEDTP